MSIESILSDHVRELADVQEKAKAISANIANARANGIPDEDMAYQIERLSRYESQIPSLKNKIDKLVIELDAQKPAATRRASKHSEPEVSEE